MGFKALGMVAQRGVVWVIGGAATAGGVYLDTKEESRARRRGGLVVPLPAAEGFKDPFLEDNLNEGDLNVLTKGQSVEWLTKSITPMWPYLDEGLKDLIIRSVEPQIQQSIPFFGNKLKFTKLTIGKEVPDLGPVTTHLTEEDDVELFVKVHYTGGLAVDFEMGVATIAIADLTIDGEVLLAFRPIVPGVNPVGGLEMCCLDQPEITLNLAAKGLFLDNVPNLYKLVKHAVDDAISNVFVAPNNVSVQIPTVTGPHTDWATLRYRPPLGVLRVEVQQVDYLPGSRWLCNPYVRLQVGAAQWFTDTQHKTTNPKWDDGVHVQEFMVYHPMQKLMLKVFDQKKMTSDNVLGQCAVPFHDIKQKGTHVLPMLSERHAELGAEVHISTEWFPAVPADTTTLADFMTTHEPVTCERTEEHTKKRDQWRNGRGCAGVHNDMITAMNIERLSGSALDGEGPHKVRATVGGQSRTTGRGFAPAEVRDLEGRPICSIAKRVFAQGTSPDASAKILGVLPQEYNEFAALEKARAQQCILTRKTDTEDKEDSSWFESVKRRMSRTAPPSYEQILYIPSKGAADFTIEVLGERDDADGKKEDYVKASQVFPMGHEGPWFLDGYTVFGSHTVNMLNRDASSA